ncbi:MAG: NAD-dependent epimerase/dehydratase family protein [Phycisphaerales bacterium]|nr:NAD-dependent epimerase/dehydratase family protein [Phycisphaerales bacterium]
MKDRVFVTGGSGFVGSAVIAELLSRDRCVNALTHRGKLKADGSRARVIAGDLFNTAALDEGMRDCQTVIHLVGIIRERPSEGITFERTHYEGAKNVIEAAKRNGVWRFILMSALGTRPGAVSRYHRTKYQAEQHLMRSGLDWTIFRPSLIHGPGGEFMQMEAGWARGRKPPFLFMPYFGGGLLGRGGAGQVQPVHVTDVARAFVDAMDNSKAVGEIYPLAGSQRLTWPQMHRIAAQAIAGKSRPVLAIPAWYAKALTYVVPPGLLPFNRDQVIMGREGSIADVSKFIADFGWEPAGFEQTIVQYAQQIE